MSTCKRPCAAVRLDREPLISVLLPVRNGEKYLREALDSILQQTYRSFEVIAIDDGSEDGSAAMLRQACWGDGPIRVVRTEGVGTADALNAGLGVARGELIARMDQDDISHPDRFGQQVDWMRQHDLDICGTFAETFGQASDVLEFPVTDEAIKLGLLVRSTILHPTAMIRTDLLRSHPYAAGSFLEDHELCVRVAPVARMGNLPKPLLRYRRHAEQTTHVRASVIRTYQQMLGVRRFLDLVPDATMDECRLLEELIEAAPSLQDPQRLRQAGELVFRRIPARSREARRVRVRIWQRVPRFQSLGPEALKVHWGFRMREALMPDRTDIARAFTALFPKRTGA